MAPAGLFNGIYQLVSTSHGHSTTITDHQQTADGSIVITIDTSVADLVATTFDATSDHVLNGQTDVAFTVTNIGVAAAGSFGTHVVWSANDVLGDADDAVVLGSDTTFVGLPAGGS